MNEKLLIKIAGKLKAVRKEKRLTVQVLADRANVSKGLISRIENGRTIPSLPVLLGILSGLETNAEDFFEGFANVDKEKEVTVIKKEEYESFEKEEAPGYHYQHITSTTIGKNTLECVLLNIDPGATRAKVSTDAYELKHILGGSVTYLIGEEVHLLEAGDSIYFNGRVPHVPLNNGDDTLSMLVVYIYDSEI